MRSRSACRSTIRTSSARSAGCSTLARCSPSSRPHLVDRAAATSGCSRLRGNPGPRRVGQHAPDLVDDELEAAVDGIALALDLHELAGVELLRVTRSTSWKSLARISPETSCSSDVEELAAVATGPPVLAGAEKESPAADAASRSAMRGRRHGCRSASLAARPDVITWPLGRRRQIEKPERPAERLAAVDGQHFARDVRRRAARRETAPRWRSRRRVPHRPSGTVLRDVVHGLGRRPELPGGAAANRSGPGATALTRIRCRAHSTASVFVMASTPALADAE